MGSNYRPQPNRNSTGAPAPRILDRNFELKSQIHRKLIGVLNLERVASIPKDRVRMEIGRVVERLLEDVSFDAPDLKDKRLRIDADYD